MRTFAGMVLLGLGLAGVSFYLAAQGSMLRGVLATVLALITCVVLGGILAGKRAVLGSILSGVKKLDLGGKALDLLFEKGLGVNEEGATGERGGKIARTLERLPLDQAEQRLEQATRAALTSTEGGKGLRGKLSRAIQCRLLRLVSQVTLARFREEGQASNGVDLSKVKEELAGLVDQFIEEKVGGAVTRLTFIMVFVCGLVSVAGALLIRQIVW